MFSIMSGHGVKRGEGWSLRDEQRLRTARGCKKTLKHIPGMKECPDKMENYEYTAYSVIY